jgi:uncharacterized protein YdiU (UPF0061 family)
MSVSLVPPLLSFENSFARELDGLYVPWQPAPPRTPQLLALNDDLAAELGLDPDALREPAGVELLSGRVVPEGAAPLAQAYSGHQFGMYAPLLGDGRALLLGEVVDVHGRRRDLHMKGSGRTPFARGGDGKAALGPMLREFVLGEAMYALGIPTTRALAVAATGEPVRREGVLPGAVLLRVAASHIRVGTFQFAAARGDAALLRRLADYTIARHYPHLAEDGDRYAVFYEAVVDAQASLLARWMLVGFIHGVMNTDNMTISGETIDYGPCAFMEQFDPSTAFSSIDHGGRYAYGNQPSIAHWNLARLGEALLPLLDEDIDSAQERATAVLDSFPERYDAYWVAGMAAKLGLRELAGGDDRRLADDLLVLLRTQKVDYTSAFRALSSYLRGSTASACSLFTDRASFEAWAHRWQARLARDNAGFETTADAIDLVNPIYIARNEKVEEALDAATAGDVKPFLTLVDVVRQPFTERPGLEAFAAPAPPSFATCYSTYCGT